MKKYILAALAAALSCIPAFAQNPTNVTGIIADPSSVAYYPAQVTACLTPVTIDPTVGGKHVNPNIGVNYCVGPVQTAPSGAFSMALYANGNITPGATQWIFTVQTAGSGPPAGKGAQTFSSAALTVSGTSQDVSTNINSVGPAQLNSGSSSSSLSPHTIDGKVLGVKSDGQVCFGVNVTVTNASTTVSCATAIFTSADVGKTIFSTNGGGGVLSFVGSTVQANSTIASITNGTTVVMQGAASGSLSSNAAAVLVWGTLDDTAWAAVDAATVAANGCVNVIIPSGLSLIASGHFHTASPTCNGSGVQMQNTNDIATTYSGIGLNSTLVPTPSFDFGASSCPATGCLFSGNNTLMIKDINVWGAGASLTGTTHSNILVGFGFGAQVINFTAMAFGASSTSLIGIKLSTVRATNLVCDGFGRICEQMGVFGGPNVLFFNFAGDTAGQNLDTGSSSTTYDYGGLYGGGTGTVNVWVEPGTTYYSFGASTFSCTNGASSQSLYNNGGTVYLDGGSWACNGAGNFGHTITSGGVTHAHGVGLNSNSGGGGLSVQSGGKFFDDCGNTVTGTNNIVGTIFGDCSITGTAFTAGAMVPSANWGTSAAVSAPFGATADTSFTLTNGSAAVGANPTLTYTFPTAYLVRPNYCTIQQTGGTQAQIVNEWSVGTPTTTSVVFTYNGTPTINLTEFIAVSCH